MYRPVSPCQGGSCGTRVGVGLMGRGLLGFEVWVRLWLVSVLCRLCVACLRCPVSLGCVIWLYLSG